LNPPAAGGQGGLAGSFEITCAVESGRSFICRQAVSAPFHMAKPYWDGRLLLVNVVNATAGVFSGDRMAMRVEVLDGAQVLLTTPSAHRIHRMQHGHAELDQVYHVGAGGWLEVMPELFIPQEGSRYRQRTRVNVEPGGELFYVETLAPGRVGRGEVFAFGEVAWELDISSGKKRFARERYTLRPGDHSLASLRAFAPTAYYAAAYLVSDQAGLASPLQERVHDVSREGCFVGMTQLTPSAWAIRVLASDSVLLKAALRDVRSILSVAWPLLGADARKI
jgi:urease accessory protein